MTPFKQLQPVNSEFFKLYGDCWRTAIGCVLNIGPEHIPHFCAPPYKDDWIEETKKWLSKHGFDLFMTPNKCDIETLLSIMGKFNPGVFWLLSGKGPQGPHVVVCQGGEIVHDPAPAGHGIVGPGDQDIYWVYVIAFKGQSKS